MFFKSFAEVVIVLFSSMAANFGINLINLAYSVRYKVLPDHVTDNASDKRSVASDKHSVASSVNTDIEEAAMIKKSSQQVNQEQINRTNKWTGILLYSFGSLLLFAAYSYSPQSMIACLESIQCVSNAIYSKYLNQTAITNRTIIGICMIIIGIIIILKFCLYESPHYTSTTLINLYMYNLAYQFYIPILCILWLCGQIVFLKYYNTRTVRYDKFFNHDFIESMSFAFTTGIIGSQIMTLSKSISNLVYISTKFSNEFLSPLIYIEFIIWLGFVIFFIRRLYMAIQEYPTPYIIPTIHIFYTFFSVISGGLYYQEFEHYTLSYILGFVFGFILIIFGIGTMIDDTNVDLTFHTIEDQQTRSHKALSIISDKSETNKTIKVTSTGLRIETNPMTLLKQNSMRNNDTTTNNNNNNNNNNTILNNIRSSINQGVQVIRRSSVIAYNIAMSPFTITEDDTELLKIHPNSTLLKNIGLAAVADIDEDDDEIEELFNGKKARPVLKLFKNNFKLATEDNERIALLYRNAYKQNRKGSTRTSMTSSTVGRKIPTSSSSRRRSSMNSEPSTDRNTIVLNRLDSETRASLITSEDDIVTPVKHHTLNTLFHTVYEHENDKEEEEKNKGERNNRIKNSENDNDELGEDNDMIQLSRAITVKNIQVNHAVKYEDSSITLDRLDTEKTIININPAIKYNIE